MKSIAEIKQDYTLNQKFSYPEGIMTRREWIEMQKMNGCSIEQDKKPSVKWDRIKFNRMNNEQQREYEKKLNKMIPRYRLNVGDGTFYEITKTEFDYFCQL